MKLRSIKELKNGMYININPDPFVLPYIYVSFFISFLYAGFTIKPDMTTGASIIVLMKSLVVFIIALLVLGIISIYTFLCYCYIEDYDD